MPHDVHVPLLWRTASSAILAKLMAGLGWQWRRQDASTTHVDWCALEISMCSDHLTRFELVVVAMAVGARLLMCWALDIYRRMQKMLQR